MNRLGLALTAVLLLWASSSPEAQTRARTPVRIPDIPGYKTLKCDFHIHTVFSDGSVWPDVRSEEAWREGLDAIAITDHIDYLPHREDLPPSHERPYEIAKPHGDILDITVIRGSEITREMPPGHLNAIFLNAVEPMVVEPWRKSLEAAAAQGAFIFWNHPGWDRPGAVASWYPEHTELVENRLMHGIEVVNTREYYAEAHRWCIEKNLTMLSNSDVHGPLNLDYHVHQGDHRPLTLVFAKDNSVEAIKEALFARRTAVYSGNLLAGDEAFLRPIFEESTEIERSLQLVGREAGFVQISNRSDISYELVRTREFAEISVPESLILQAGKTVLLQVTATQGDRSWRRSFSLEYEVSNLKITPDRSLRVELQVEVGFSPSPQS